MSTTVKLALSSALSTAIFLAARQKAGNVAAAKLSTGTGVLLGAAIALTR